MDVAVEGGKLLARALESAEVSDAFAPRRSRLDAFRTAVLMPHRGTIAESRLHR